MEGDFGWHYGGDGYNNWDLGAVVRLGCGGPVAPPYVGPFFALPQPPQQDVLADANVWQQEVMDLQAMADPADVWQQVMDMPVMADPAANVLQPAMDMPVIADPANVWQQAMDLPEMADPAVVAGLDDDDFLTQFFFGAPQPSPPTNEAVPPQQVATAANSPPAVDKPESSRAGGSSRPKQARRSKKNMEVSAVVTVPLVHFASADVWAWRKYGQKPIKGSPNPRGYYRCSTDKACPARKMVELCLADANSVVVTYTGMHTHAVPRVRNALTGIVRYRREAPPRKPPAELLVGGPSHHAPPPPPPQVPAAAAVYPPPTPPRCLYPNEFEEEEDDDAVAVKALIDDAAMAPENAFLFPNPDNRVLPVPEMMMAIGASHGGTANGAGGGRGPVINVVMDTLFVSGWESAAGAAAGRQGM